MDHQTQPHQFNYSKVQLFKNESLGTGSYRSVCKATRDLLPCAAKLLHPILFQFDEPGVLTPRKRFEQECYFLNAIKHPHIVQYLGTTQDTDSDRPVLLMELMDENLTHFLKKCEQQLPYHAEVNLCLDIALALTYLHSNDIIHRDLSSNNVLLNAGGRAKVTDFGMSKFLNASPNMTPLTMCPGTTAYMPPETLKDPPVYSKKIDCFSFGVLEIQIMTRQFPNPGPATRLVNDPRSPTGRMLMPILDSERRKSHIILINPTHPLLQIALPCLSYSEEERPSAEDVCQKLAILKEGSGYTQSVQQDLQAGRTPQINTESETIQTLQQNIIQLSQELVCANKQVQEKQHAIDVMEMQLQQLNQQIQVKPLLLPIKQRNAPPIPQPYRSTPPTPRSKRSTTPTPHHQNTPRQRSMPPQRSTPSTPQRSTALTLSPQRSTPMTPTTPQQSFEKNIHDLKWYKCNDAPEKMWRGSAVSKGKMAYFNHLDSTTVHAYNSETQEWSTLPECPYKYTTLVLVANTLLTAIGGRQSGKPTNALHSLVGSFRNRKWAEYFPPMPTKRYLVAAAFDGKSLIVAGGYDGNTSLSIVEVLDIEWLQWSNTSRLPHPLYWAAAVVCGDRLFLLGGIDQTEQTLSVMTCSVSKLLQPQLLQGKLRTIAVAEQPTVWHQAADVPFNLSTCAVLNGQVVAVGGYKDGKNTAAIFAYDSTSDSWQALREMTTARYRSLVTELPGHQLMVVGGWGTKKHTAAVEIATVVGL